MNMIRIHSNGESEGCQEIHLNPATVSKVVSQYKRANKKQGGVYNEETDELDHWGDFEVKIYFINSANPDSFVGDQALEVYKAFIGKEAPNKPASTH